MSQTPSVSGPPPDRADRTSTPKVEFEAEVGSCLEGMYGYAYRALSNAEDADDAVSTAVENAWKAWGRFRGDSSFKTWIYRILHNVTIDVLRKRQTRPTLPRKSPRATDGPDGMDTIEPADDHTRIDDAVITKLLLEQALASLRPEVRQALLLVEREGLSQQAAADVLNVSRSRVLSWLSEGRRVVRRVVELDEDPLP